MAGRRSRLLATLALVAAGMSGCSLPGLTRESAPPEPVVDCLATPQETCRTALTDARANAPSGERLVRVRVTCSIPACTLLAGTAQVDAMYSDGSVVSYETDWSGPDQGAPAAATDPGSVTILPVTPTCVGLDGDRCREMAKNIIVPQGPPRRVVSILVTCTAAACTAHEGQGTTLVTFDDGAVREADWAYAGD
jgi:hypothetical protein